MDPLQGIEEIEKSFATIINALRAIKANCLFVKESVL
jgi:hypothetical protein